LRTEGRHSYPKHLLLCYLLLNRDQPHTREHLAALFWGEYPTRTSRKYMRNALWRLRHVLHSVGAPADYYLNINDDSISFSREGHLWLDIEDFETVTIHNQEVSGRDLTAAEARQLEKAVELYTGDLLAGIYEDWCLYERERLHLLHLNTLGKLAIFHELNGTYEQGLAFGRRILACDNTRESVHRQMMRLYWQSGNRGAALAQYKLCTQILHESLGISPLEETTRLYEQMRYGQYNPEAWRGVETDQLLIRAGREASAARRAEQALQRLRHLEEAIDQIHAELQQIERQLVGVLSGIWDTGSFSSGEQDEEKSER
jgi:DNA-binding SARP family transcriptional activator